MSNDKLREFAQGFVDDYASEDGMYPMKHYAKLAHEALAANKPEPQCQDGLLPDGPTCPKCGGARAPSGVDGGSWVHLPASNPEPQAQAGEPEVVAYGDRLGSHRQQVYAIPSIGVPPWMKVMVPLITLQSHREAMEAVYRDANEKAFSIAKKDAALKACVESMEYFLNNFPHNENHINTLTQAEEAMK